MNTARLVTITALATIGLLAIGSGGLATGSGSTTDVPPGTATVRTVDDPGRPSTTTTPARPPTTSRPPTTPGGGGVPPAPIDIDEAAAIALDRAGGGRVTDIEWDRGYRRDVWEVEIVNARTEHDLDIDAESGEILSHKIDRDDYWDD